MEAKDIDVRVTEDTVVINAERCSETKTQERAMTRSEYRYGKFQPMIPLPARVQNTHKSFYVIHVLEITIPQFSIRFKTGFCRVTILSCPSRRCVQLKTSVVIRRRK
jgi:HSP20 family molecular chaperone IbpA